MTRLIDADALNAEMYHKSFEVDDGRNVWNSGLWIRYKIFEEAIRDAPTVDAVPVVHGEWENGRYRSVDQTGETYDDGEALICTNCRNGFRKRIVDWRWKYCPACGARMDENETES